jgi:ArsR family transcriptional regulator
MNLLEAEKLLGTLAHETRIRLLKILAVIEEEVCVCELEDALDIPQYSVSRHLNKLKDRGLVESRREGTWAYYSLSSELGRSHREIISWIQNYVDEETLKKDKKEMKERLALRENGKCVVGDGEEGSCK